MRQQASSVNPCWCCHYVYRCIPVCLTDSVSSVAQRSSVNVRLFLFVFCRIEFTALWFTCQKDLEFSRKQCGLERRTLDSSVCGYFTFRSHSNHSLDLCWVIPKSNSPRIGNSLLVCFLTVRVFYRYWNIRNVAQLRLSECVTLNIPFLTKMRNSVAQSCYANNILNDTISLLLYFFLHQASDEKRAEDAGVRNGYGGSHGGSYGGSHGGSYGT